jgi:hypothetical protein
LHAVSLDPPVGAYVGDRSARASFYIRAADHIARLYESAKEITDYVIFQYIQPQPTTATRDRETRAAVNRRANQQHQNPDDCDSDTDDDAHAAVVQGAGNVQPLKRKQPDLSAVRTAPIYSIYITPRLLAAIFKPYKNIMIIPSPSSAKDRDTIKAALARNHLKYKIGTYLTSMRVHTPRIADMILKVGVFFDGRSTPERREARMLLYAPATFACIISEAVEVALSHFEATVGIPYLEVYDAAAHARNAISHSTLRTYEAAAVQATAANVIVTYAYANPTYFPSSFLQQHEGVFNTAVTSARECLGIKPLPSKRKSILPVA